MPLTLLEQYEIACTELLLKAQLLPNYQAGTPESIFRASLVAEVENNRFKYLGGEENKYSAEKAKLLLEGAIIYYFSKSTIELKRAFLNKFLSHKHSVEEPSGSSQESSARFLEWKGETEEDRKLAGEAVEIAINLLSKKPLLVFLHFNLDANHFPITTLIPFLKKINTLSIDLQSQVQTELSRVKYSSSPSKTKKPSFGLSPAVLSSTLEVTVKRYLLDVKNEDEYRLRLRNILSLFASEKSPAEVRTFLSCASSLQQKAAEAFSWICKEYPLLKFIEVSEQILKEKEDDFKNLFLESIYDATAQYRAILAQPPEISTLKKMLKHAKSNLAYSMDEGYIIVNKPECEKVSEKNSSEESHEETSYDEASYDEANHDEANHDEANHDEANHDEASASSSRASSSDSTGSAHVCQTIFSDAATDELYFALIAAMAKFLAMKVSSLPQKIVVLIMRKLLTNLVNELESDKSAQLFVVVKVLLDETTDPLLRGAVSEKIVSRLGKHAVSENYCNEAKKIVSNMGVDMEDKPLRSFLFSNSNGLFAGKHVLTDVEQYLDSSRVTY